MKKEKKIKIAVILSITIPVAVGILQIMYLLFDHSQEKNSEIAAQLIRKLDEKISGDYSNLKNQGDNYQNNLNSYLQSRNEVLPQPVNVKINYINTIQPLTDSVIYIERNLDSLVATIIQVEELIKTLKIPKSDFYFFNNNNISSPENNAPAKPGFWSRLGHAFKKMINKWFSPSAYLEVDNANLKKDFELYKERSDSIVTEALSTIDGTQRAIDKDKTQPELVDGSSISIEIDTFISRPPFIPKQASNTAGTKSPSSQTQSGNRPKPTKVLTESGIVSLLNGFKWEGEIVGGVNNGKTVQFEFNENQCSTNYFSKKMEKIETISFGTQPTYRKLGACIRFGTTKELDSDDYFKVIQDNNSKDICYLVHYYRKKAEIPVMDSDSIVCRKFIDNK